MQLHDEFAQPALGPDTRARNLDRLKNERFDVLILGGGINGAGIARDLALRARRAGVDLAVALIDQRQFGSGTSSRNSQLIHGGLRYLKHLEFRLVREALHERSVLLGLAPHLVEPLPFLLPLYSQFARVQYGCGLWLYDLLAGSRNVGRHGRLSRAEAASLEPGLNADGLVSAAAFYDCRVNSARFLLANVFDAARNGAVVANHLRAESWNQEDRLWRVRVTDGVSGERFEIWTRKLVDTTGPWSRAGDLRLVRGSHIVVPRVNASDRAIAHFERGRIVFVIPWGERGDLSLVGTTDVDHAHGPDDVRPAPAEMEYLTGVLARLFSRARHEPVAAFSSLRPLLRTGSRSATRTSREHRIWNSPDGILHVAGGKYTTYRAMSEEAVDAVTREIAPKLASLRVTASQPLEGNSAERIAALREDPACSQAVGLYGAQAEAVLAYRPERAPAGLSRLDAARIAYSVRHEMAQSLADLLFISTYWGYEQEWKRSRFEPHAGEMARHLGWPPARIEQELELARCLAAPPPHS